MDTDGIQAEKEKVRDDIRRTSVATLHPPLDENALIQKLVAQYLSMDGFVETARAFASEVKKEARALANGSTNSRGSVDLEPEQDLDAVKRQRELHDTSTKCSSLTERCRDQSRCAAR